MCLPFLVNEMWGGPSPPLDSSFAASACGRQPWRLSSSSTLKKLGCSARIFKKSAPQNGCRQAGFDRYDKTGTDERSEDLPLRNHFRR